MNDGPVDQQGAGTFADFGALSPREREVTQLLARGLTRGAIASTLYRSPKTIDNHCTRIYKKLGVQSQSQLVSLVYERGLGPDLVGESVSGSRPSLRQDDRLLRALAGIELRIRSATELGLLGALVAALADACAVDTAGVCEFDEQRQEIMVIAAVDRGEPCEQRVCPVGSLCKKSFDDGEYFARHIEASSGCSCKMFETGGIRGYAGVLLERRPIGSIGSLWIADRKPLTDGDFALDVLRSLRRRVGTELALQIAIDRLDEFGLSLRGEGGG